MAKQLVNPIERHVEKAVVGITGLLLIAVIVSYVFTSPNKLQLGAEPVTPGVIDAKLALKANEILDRIRNARPPEVKHDPLYDEFASALSPLKGERLVSAVAPGPFVPLIDSPEAVVGRATLVKVQATEKPLYTLGRNTMLVKNQQGDEIRKATDWVTVSVLFDVKAQSELQRKTWGATKSDVVFVTPEVQRRMRRTDGSWSDDDWQTVNPWPSFTVPPPPTVRLVRDGEKTVAVKDDQKAAEKYELDIQEPAVQLNTLRPSPPAVVNDGNPWRFPLLSTYEDVLKQDDEFLHPKEPPLATPDDRYGLKTAEAPKVVKQPKTPADAVAQQFEDARKLFESADKARSKNDAMTAYNQLLDISANREATPDVRDKAAKLMKRAEQLALDIAREDATKGRAGPAPVPQPGGQPTQTPAREKAPRQQIWAHDWAEGSVVSGATYQYRMRIRVLNRLAGYPENFADPQDATVFFVTGDWSPPTEPITIPNASLFFVTRDDPKRRELGVEFFRWYDGVWIKSGTVKVLEGERLSHQTRVPVPGIADRNVAENALVDFDIDATLMDIDFARPHRERKAGASAAGVKFGAPAPSATAVFVDSKGRLVERIVALDKSHPAKRTIKTYSPPK